MTGLITLLALILIIVGVIMIAVKHQIALGVVLIVVGCLVFLLRFAISDGTQRDASNAVASLILAHAIATP